MSHGVLVQLAGIVILGVIAQWIAWRLRLPSILLLLAAGIVVGPMTDMIQSDQLLGDLLLPFVSLSIAVILYEGGLNLRFRELRQLGIGGVFFRMTTIAALISWVIGAVAAHYVVGFRWPVAALLGAILVVTGPTVIGPILRHLRLRGRVGALLKWEGIIIDPLGATLAVLVFAVVRATEVHVGIAEASVKLGEMLVVGVLFGCAAAGMFVLVLRRFWIPDSLHNPVSLMLVVASFTAAHAVQDESGLLAVTVMGIVLANQQWVSIRHVVEFKETLRVLLISCLFITLAARLQLQDLRSLGWESVLFVGVMVCVARPVSVLAATMGSALAWRERLFLAWMAPRGIVAAAVASVFALELSANGYPRAIEMVPVTFLLVFVSVLVYGVSAGPLARRLGLVHMNPQGVLFIGAHAWARAMADALQSENYPVLLIDTDWKHICEARMAGLPCLFGSALADSTREEIDFGGLGRLLAVTSNNEVNALACMRYIDDFGRQEVYQLPFPTAKKGRHEVVPLEHRGRFLFGKELTFAGLTDAFGSVPIVKKTGLTNEFDYNAFQSKYADADGAVPLFIMKPNGTLQICTVEGFVMPQPGDLLFRVPRDSNNDSSNQALDAGGVWTMNRSECEQARQEYGYGTHGGSVHEPI